MSPADRGPGRREGVRVLVTGAGGPAAVSFLRAMDGPGVTDGSGVECWAVDIDPCAAGLYLVPAARRALVPRGDDPGFVDALLGLCRRDAIDVLVPTVDVELLPVCRDRSAFEEGGTTVLAPSVTTLERCLDKWELARASAGLGITPRTELLDDRFDAGSWAWPAVVKPRRGSGSRGVAVVEDPADLRAAPRDGTHIVQAYLPGVEYSLDVLAYRDGRVAAVVPRSRLKVDSGIAVAGCTGHAPHLEELGRRVAAAVELTSVANVQVKEDADGEARLLEVNPRFPGTMPLTVASGVDMPALALADALGRPVPPTVDFRPVAMVRHWQEVFMEVSELVPGGTALVPEGVR